MNLSDIQELVLQGESSKLEFKKSTAQLHSAFETICAFLNGDGGVVLIGVLDNGKIIGQEVSDTTRKDIAHEIGRLEPSPHLDIDYILIEGPKKIIGIQVKSESYYPYMYDGRAYHREQSVTKRMTQQRYDYLVSKRSQLNYAWETFVTDYPLEFLDYERISNFVKDAVTKKRMPELALRETKEKLLERLKLVKNGKLLNAAIVLFGKEFLPDYPQCQLKIARFKGLDRREFMENVIIYGNAFDLLERAEDFLIKSLPIAAKIVPGHLQRVETPLIPYEATREALINAICHRDYAIRGGTVSIAIYDDRLEIFNNGGLSKNVSLDMIKEGYSDPKNPLIADIFHKAGLIEKWGRGVQEIITSCENAGDPEPIFEIKDDISFSVTLKFPYHLRNIIFSEYSLEDIADSLGIEKESIKQLTKRQIEILRMLSSGEERTFSQVSQQIKDKPIARTLRNDLYKLESIGLIGKRGTTKNNKWFILK